MAILRDAGPCLNPFAASLAIAGLASLSPRVDRHNSNALALAAWLQTSDEDKVAKVVYPGLATHRTFSRTQKYLRQGAAAAGYGAVLHFALKKGGRESAAALAANLKLIKRSDGYVSPSYFFFLSKQQVLSNRTIKPLTSCVD